MNPNVNPVVSAAAKKNVLLWGGGILVAIVIIMLLVSGIKNYRARHDNNSGSQNAGSVGTTAAVVQACPNLKTGVRLETDPGKKVRINPDGRCAADMWHPGHCFMLLQALSTKPKKLCPGDSSIPDIEWVWAADEAFDAAFALAPPRYSVLANIR